MTTVLVMRRRTSTPESLLRLAASQSGIVSRAQAVDHGVGRHTIARLLRDQQWYGVADGVYSHSPTPSWTALAWAGLLLADGDGVLGAEAALHLHGVGDPPETITVWSGQHRLRDRNRWRFREGTRAARGSPPRVSLEDATLEVCAAAALDGVIAVLAAAVAGRRTTVDRLRSRAIELVNLRNRRLVLDLLHDVSDGIESPLESRYLTDVERAHALPVGVRQLSLSDGTRSDVVYTDHAVVVELDGRLGHSGHSAFRDAARDNRHTVAGFVTLRFGWNDVAQNPCAVAAQVAAVLASRGWPGKIRLCRRCRPPSATAPAT
ncbi:MAG: DUF559 domain-containing protein [Arachnia sp.]